MLKTAAILSRNAPLLQSIMCSSCKLSVSQVPAKLIPRQSLIWSTSRQKLASFTKSATKVKALQPLGPKPMGYVKPILFVGAFGFATYAGCAIWEYETLLSLRKRSLFKGTWYEDDMQDDLSGGPWFKGFYPPGVDRPPKRGEFRRQANSWWNSLTNGQKTVVGLIAANAIVLAFIRIAVVNPSLAPIVTKYFLLSPTSSMTSLVASTFSHYSLFHFGMNMYVLWTLAPFAHIMGQPQFTAFYTTAGVFANVASIIFRQLPFNRIVVASLGASGCLYAVIGALCIRFPHVQFGVPIISDILPALHFKAESLWPALLTFDLVGLLLGFRVFDHVAHMGGLLFGVWYAKWGDKWLWSKRFRHVVIATWRRVRGKQSSDD